MRKDNPVIDIVNTTTGERRKVRYNAFVHWQADKGANTRGGGWIETTPEAMIGADGTMNFTDKIAQAAVIPSVPAQPEKKSAEGAVSDDQTFMPEVEAPVIDPLGNAEVITEPEPANEPQPVAEKAKPKRKPAPRKRK